VVLTWNEDRSHIHDDGGTHTLAHLIAHLQPDVAGSAALVTL